MVVDAGVATTVTAAVAQVVGVAALRRAVRDGLNEAALERNVRVCRQWLKVASKHKALGAGDHVSVNLQLVLGLVRTE